MRNLHPTTQEPSGDDAFSSMDYSDVPGYVDYPSYHSYGDVSTIDNAPTYEDQGLQGSTIYDGSYTDARASDDSFPTSLGDATWMDDSELEKKFEELKIRTQDMEKGRRKVLGLAFGAGAATLCAAAAVMRVIARK